MNTKSIMRRVPVLGILASLVFQSLEPIASAAPMAPATHAPKIVESPAAETAGQRAARMAWFRDARFGLFVVWGPYSVLGGEYHGKQVNWLAEWIQHTGRIPAKEYEAVAAGFNPVKFDAKQWVRLAKDSGMKYLVITAKFHDGFCMWDSKLTDYNIVKWSGFKRDVIVELARECQKEGLKLGIYYSVRDWHHPDWTLRYVDLEKPRQYNSRWGFVPSPWTKNNYHACGCPTCVSGVSPLSKEFDPRPTEAEGADMNRYLDYMKGQLTELLTQCGPVDLMWFDAQDIVDPKLGRVEEMVATMRRLQPKVIINDRIGPGHPAFGDYGVHEGRVPGTSIAREWETCMTMNDTWGFSKFDNNWKSAQTLVRTLVETTSKNGNFLLAVGPDGEGVISPAYLERLKQVGQWMAVNEASIRGCGSSNVPAPEWGRITANGDTLYLHVFDWPADGRLTVKKLAVPVKQARLLADAENKALPVTQTADEIVITVPDKAPSDIDSVIALTVTQSGNSQ